MTSARKISANRENAKKSTGPRSRAGKKNTSSNALKHGFYSRELDIREDQRADFETLRETLCQQLSPETPLQKVAFEQIVSSCWRCKLAIRLEMQRLKTEFAIKPRPPIPSIEQQDANAIQWHGANRQNIRHGLKVLHDLRLEISRDNFFDFKSWKRDIVDALGPDFYAELERSSPTRLLRRQLNETLGNEGPVEAGLGAPPNDKASQPANSKLDGEQELKMPSKLIDEQIQFLTNLDRALLQDGVSRDFATDFLPRYFASASRDLQRSVDCLLYLRSKGL